MAWTGFENFGAQFAPLADAQLKEAYNDYQAQKDLGAAQRQLGQDRLAAQEGAVKYGLESPLANRIPVDPTITKQLGDKGPDQGEDPLAHMQDFIGQLNKQYPGVVDDKGTVNPAVYGRLMEMRKIQQALEADAAKISERNKAALELQNVKQKNALELEGVRSKNIASRSRQYESPQQKQISKEIEIKLKAMNQPFVDPDIRLQLQGEVEQLKEIYNNQPAQSVAPVQTSQKAPVNDGYKAWLDEYGAPDSPKNKEFYNQNIKGK